MPLPRILELGLFEKVSRIKFDVPNDQLELLDGYDAEIDEKIRGLVEPK